MNFLIEDDEESKKFYNDYLNKEPRSYSNENKTQIRKIQKFVYESKSLLNTDQQIKIFINDPVNRKMFNNINDLEIEKLFTLMLILLKF